MDGETRVDKTKSAQVRAEGNTAFKKGRWQQSIDLYSQAASLDPSDPTALCNRAQAYLKLDRFEEAENDCTAALTLDSSNLKALYRRALSRRGLNRIDSAAQDLESLLELDPQNQQALAELEEQRQLQPQKEQPVETKTPAPAEKPSASFADLRKSRQATKATFAAKSEPTPLSSPPPEPPENPNSTDGGAGIQLLRKLTQLSPTSGWTYLAYYPPENISLVLRDLLDPESLGRVLLALEAGSKMAPGKVATIMNGLRNTPRFQMNSLMLSAKEREAGQNAWRNSGGSGSW